ncbi:hypothetical protein N9F08_00130 [bacterium]|nr:hypothetical protein [bacterium]
MDKLNLYKGLFQISIATYFFGTLFRIMHWPYSSLILVSALVLITISSVLYFSSKLEKSFVDELAIVGAPTWALFKILSITHAPYQLEFRTGILVIAAVYLCYRGVKWYQKARKSQQKGVKRISIERASYIVGAILIGIGLLFKIQHWPYSRTMLYLGMGLMILNFFLSLFTKEEKD